MKHRGTRMHIYKHRHNTELISSVSELCINSKNPVPFKVLFDVRQWGDIVRKWGDAHMGT